MDRIIHVPIEVEFENEYDLYVNVGEVFRIIWIDANDGIFYLKR